MLAALFVGLAAWSWRKWTDVHIDFGNQLYVAWRLAEGGEALYRDIAHRNGPLSHYVNAALFRVFGVSLRTLVFANLAVLAGITALFYRILAPAAGRLATTAACAFFLAVFGFSQYVPIGNFNYVTPYQHFQTHGLALALVLVWGLGSWCHGGSRRGAGLAGAALGALFLTKAELFVPAAGAVGAAGAWLVVERRPGAARPAKAFAGAALAVPLLALAGLALAMPLATAARGVLGNWVYLGDAAADPFYRAGAGLVDVEASLAALAAASAGVAAAVGLSVALDRVLPAFGSRRVVAAVTGVLLAAGLVGLASPRLAWLGLPRALPLVITALVAAGAWLAVRAPELRPVLCGPWLLAVLALGLLGKMLLAARFEHYGFVLAAPAAVLAVAAWTGGVPAALRRRGGEGDLARAVALACVFALAFAYLERSDLRYRVKDFPVGSGADRILAEPPTVTPRPAIVAATLGRLAALMAPGETLLVLPQGMMLNYWLRRENPTSFDIFVPTEIAAFGEDAMLRDLDAHPPDWIVLAHRLSGEFGVGPFGRDPRNGRALLAWVSRHYERVERLGAEPFSGRGFGTVVLRRRTSAAPDADPVRSGAAGAARR